MILSGVPAQSRRSFAALQDDRDFRDHLGEKSGDSKNIFNVKKVIYESPLFSLYTTKQ